MENEKKKKKPTLTDRVLRQDLTFERTNENRITRPFMARGKARRIYRLLKKPTVFLTVMKDGKVVTKGCVDRKGLETAAERFALDYRPDITYNSLGEVRIVLKKLNATLTEQAAG